MLYQVFENDKPAQYPDIAVHPSWNKSSYTTLKEAQEYLHLWLGSYSPEDWIPLGQEYYYNGEDYVIIKEVES